MKKTLKTFFLGILTAGFFGSSLHALTYSIDWYKIAGGAGSLGDAGVYSLTGTIGQPDAGVSLSAGPYSMTGGFWSLVQAAPNHPPVAGMLTVTRRAGQTLKIGLSQLAALWTDADGDSMTLTGMDATSTNHLTLHAISWTNGVSLAASAANFSYGYIGYTNGPNVNDQFNYTLSDGQGGTAVGTVTIAVSSSPLFGQVQTFNPVIGRPVLVFLGHPGYTYSVQRTTSLSPENWVSIWTTNAPAAGMFNYTDDFVDLGGTAPGAAYYRLSWAP